MWTQPRLLPLVLALVVLGRGVSLLPFLSAALPKLTLVVPLLGPLVFLLPCLLVGKTLALKLGAVGLVGPTSLPILVPPNTLRLSIATPLVARLAFALLAPMSLLVLVVPLVLQPNSLLQWPPTSLLTTTLQTVATDPKCPPIQVRPKSRLPLVL